MSGISNESFVSTEGVDAICKEYHKRKAFSIVSMIFGDFNNLMNPTRHENETFYYFESIFLAQSARYSADVTSMGQHECIKAIFVMSNANIPKSQCASMLSSVVATADDDDEDTTNEQMINSVLYESFASVIRQCDKDVNKHEMFLTRTSQTPCIRTLLLLTTIFPIIIFIFNPIVFIRIRMVSVKYVENLTIWADDHNSYCTVKPGTISQDNQPSKSSSSR